MKNKKYIIACSQNFFKNNIKDKNFEFIYKKKQLNLVRIKKIKPKIIFFPYWHWKVNDEILNSCLCIGFHTSPLPYGRGGSPIQNQILRSKKNSVICAIKYNNTIDGGEIYMKSKISLTGSANQIFDRMFKKILAMILKLKKKLPKLKKQKGKVILFKRRKPYQSEIKNIRSIKKLYDFIRMLDLDFKDFPKSFINYENFKIKFSKAKVIRNKLVCEAEIRLK